MAVIISHEERLICQMRTSREIEQRFLDEVMQYDGVVKRVCFMYSSNMAPFDDLYQETMVNLWRGFASFRGESQLSTWIYRTAINTCVTWFRRNKRFSDAATLDETVERIAGDDDDERRRDLADMYKLISRLDPVEKAIIMMWLDERSYDDIAEVTGISHGAVATRLYRIKQKLKDAETREGAR